MKLCTHIDGGDVIVQATAEGDGMLGDMVHVVTPGQEFLGWPHKDWLALGDGEYDVEPKTLPYGEDDLLTYARRHHKSAEGQGFFEWGEEQEKQHPRGEGGKWTAGAGVAIGAEGVMAKPKPAHPITGQKHVVAEALRPHFGDEADALAKDIGLTLNKNTLYYKVWNALPKQSSQPADDATPEQKEALRKANNESAQAVRTKTDEIVADVTGQVLAHLHEHGITAPDKATLAVPGEAGASASGTVDLSGKQWDENKAGENQEARNFAAAAWQDPPAPYTVSSKKWIALRSKQKLEETKKDLKKIQKLNARYRLSEQPWNEKHDPADVAKINAELKKPAMQKLLNKYRYPWNKDDQTIGGAEYTAKEFLSTAEQAWNDPKPSFNQYSEIGVLAHKEHLDALKEAAANGYSIPDEVLEDYAYEDWIPPSFKSARATKSMIDGHAGYMKNEFAYSQSHFDKAMALAMPKLRPLLDQAQATHAAAQKELADLGSWYNIPSRIHRDEVKEKRKAFLKPYESSTWDAELGIHKTMVDVPEDKVDELVALDAELLAAETDFHAKWDEHNDKTEAVGQRWLAPLLPKGGNAAAVIPAAEFLGEKGNKNLAKANAFLQKAIGPAWGAPKVDLVQVEGNRANCSGSKIRVTPNEAVSTLIHEYGHLIEHQQGDTLGTLAKAFAMDRVRSHGETPKHLGNSYEAHEIGAQDGFMDSYVGKYYPQDASEVLSMGLQAMYEKPLTFLEAAPNHFAFTIAAMHGMLHE